jgi:cytoskeleton protein RodZ
VATFGTRLRVEREQRGITLDQISRSTKIGTRFLQALEQDRFDQLPGGIFNKGFIRAYARFLGLDEEQTLSDYLTATSPGDPSPAVPETAVPVPAESERSRSLPWGTFAMLLLAIALSFAVWGFYTREPATRAKPQVPPTSTSTGSASSSTDSILPPAAGTPSDSEPNPAEVRTAPPEIPSDSSSHPAPSAPSSTNDSLAPSKSEPESPSTKAPVSAASLVQASFAVHIKAREDAWVLITADGKKQGEETLGPGAEKLIKAAKQIVIRTGNSGALDFEFNGQKLPIQGVLGEVKTLEFGPSGLEVTVSNPPTARTPPP